MLAILFPKVFAHGFVAGASCLTVPLVVDQKFIPVPTARWRTTGTHCCEWDEEDMIEETAAMERYRAMGLVDPFGRPQKRSLSELVGNAGPEDVRGLQESQDADEDDDFTTEEALEQSRQRLDVLLKRAEAERGRPLEDDDSGADGED